MRTYNRVAKLLIVFAVVYLGMSLSFAATPEAPRIIATPGGVLVPGVPFNHWWIRGGAFWEHWRPITLDLCLCGNDVVCPCKKG